MAVRRGDPARRSGVVTARRVTGLTRLAVGPRLGGKHKGWLRAGPLTLPCVLGPAGLTRRKREGDGATPIGRFALSSCFFRADRQPRPRCRLPVRACRAGDGWCDDPEDASYNKPVQLPFAGRHEAMWRADRLYDLGVVINYNRSPPLKGRGSAIFLHVMSMTGGPTAGCVALRPQDVRRLLPRLARHCRLHIG